MPAFDIVMAQLNPRVGDIDGNSARVIATAQHFGARKQCVIVLPELTLSGYPPEDLLLRPSVGHRVERALSRLARELPPALHVVVGYPSQREGRLYNAAGVFHGGELVAEYHKLSLPNYQVFDEKRYFEPGDEPCVIPIHGVSVGLTICEDIWDGGPVERAINAGARLILNLNASPFHRNKQAERLNLVRQLATRHRCSLVYVNQVGGQDELVFDGGSFAVNGDGFEAAAAPTFEEGCFELRAQPADDGAVVLSSDVRSAPLPELDAIWRALVLGVRDYVDKNGFPGVVLGLSGGIDSALTLALAVDALGPERVEALMMPFRYTSSMSVEDAAEQSRLLGVRHSVISIEPIYEAALGQLDERFAGLAADTTEENLQARCRGILLMSISNKTGALVLTTGNKSEMAVGYSTLYGDMAGGFDVLKDVPKTLVYALSRHRNLVGPCIPERVIDRPPSAELAPDQRDDDSLPPYDLLDEILEQYVERDRSLEDMVRDGLPRDAVERTIRLVDRNEYKRRQAPIGVRISRRAFGRDRRYPITSAWQPGD